MKDLLNLTDLTVNYHKGGKTLKAVKSVTIKIPEGKIVGLVGESGSGKSTIAKAVMGIVKYNGKIHFEGNFIEKRDKNFYKNIQMIFQNPYGSLNPRMRIKRILEEPLQNFKVCSKKNIEIKIRDLIKKVGLSDDVLERTTSELSGGQLQRIAIGRALSLNPRVLIADEPMSGLDMSIKAQIINLFKKLHVENKFSILLISHDLNLVGYLSDYIYVIYKGIIVERGSRDEIIKKQKHPYTKLLFNSSPSLWKDRETLKNTKNKKKKDVNSLCPFAPLCDFYTKECESETLEEQRLSETHHVKCFNFN